MSQENIEPPHAGSPLGPTEMPRDTARATSAMPEETIEAVSRFIDAFNAQDIGAMVEMAAPDCIIVAQRSGLEGAFLGHEGVRRWAEDAYGWAPDSRMVVERALSAGDDRVVVLGRQTGTAGTGGPSFDVPLAVVAEVEAGLLKKAEAQFVTHAEALEAAGMSE